MAIEVRPVGPDKRADWEPLWRDYLAFYDTVLPPATYDLTWRRLHDPSEPTFVLGGTVDGTLKGIVHYLFHRSNWTIADVCYLRDLFVAADARGPASGARRSKRWRKGRARLAPHVSTG
jgi:hypothetical protein